MALVAYDQFGIILKVLSHDLHINTICVRDRDDLFLYSLLHIHEDADLIHAEFEVERE